MTKLTIKELKEQLALITDPNDPLLETFKLDTRKGAQAALKQWYKNQEKIQLVIDQFHEKNIFEIDCLNAGYRYIAGIDEVGRGPLAGPVVSAAVILHPDKPIYGLDDSKKLSLAKRLQLFDEINEKAIAVGIGVISPAEIDRINILQATKKAMNLAVSELPVAPDFLLVDAVKLDNPVPQEIIIKGDLRSNSIAAASIIAKVTRDNMMMTYDKEYPGYGFLSNSGYGTGYLKGYKLVTLMSDEDRDDILKYNIGPDQMEDLENIKVFLDVNKFEPLEIKDKDE